MRPENGDSDPATVEKGGLSARMAEPHRRGVLRAVLGSAVGLGFSALGLAGGLWAAAMARFMMPNAVAEPPQRLKVGPPGGLPPGYVETKYKERFGIWIVHGLYRGRPQIYALRTTCTHLGCITTWQPTEQRFKCPCHGSGFYADGVNFEGPAPRPLERCAIRIADDGQLEVDKNRTFREELGQWSDPRLLRGGMRGRRQDMKDEVRRRLWEEWLLGRLADDSARCRVCMGSLTGLPSALTPCPSPAGGRGELRANVLGRCHRATRRPASSFIVHPSFRVPA